jgi:hypothetical protein
VNSLQAAEEEYDPDFHTEDKMKEDAEALYKMGQGTSEVSEPFLFTVSILVACWLTCSFLPCFLTRQIRDG